MYNVNRMYMFCASIHGVSNLGDAYLLVLTYKMGDIHLNNTCSLHLATHFQNQTSHMGMFYMVSWWQG